MERCRLKQQPGLGNINLIDTFQLTGVLMKSSQIFILSITLKFLLHFKITAYQYRNRNYLCGYLNFKYLMVFEITKMLNAIGALGSLSICLFIFYVSQLFYLSNTSFTYVSFF